MKEAKTTTPADAPDLLDAALAYAAEGLPVFPLHNPLSDGRCSCNKPDCGSVGKHPRTANGFRDATTNEEQIRHWWKLSPDANIGLPTGAISGLFVIDVDGDEGRESMLRLSREHGSMPSTKTIITGRGRQLYFRHPGGKIRNAGPISKEYPGLDSRGDGGYVVAPPSLHANGRRYVLSDTAPDQVAEAPSWLIDFVNTPPRGPSVRLAAMASRAANDPIAEGSRNGTLASVAGSMRRRGMAQEAIEAALLTTNQQQCDPPLPDDEVRAIAHSIARYAPADRDDVSRTLTDVGNAERFAKQWGDAVRYVPELGKWLVWMGTHWQPDAVGTVVEMAKKTAFEIYMEGDNLTDGELRQAVAKHSKGSQQASRLRAMFDLAKSIPALVVPIERLDANPWLLGVENGTLDLRQGALMPANRDDYITKVAPLTFDAAAQCPVFLAFVAEIMGGDQDLVGYLQRLFGYALSGDTSEQRLFFLYGTGANGKSTLLNVFKGILGGELCRQTPVETIMARPNRSGATPELACLKGARTVMTTEIDEGSFLSESLVKQMTGGDPVAARHLYGAPFEFVPLFKLFMAGNHKPVIRGGDEGIWRRIDLIPFEVTIPAEKRDPELAAKLRAELPGILNWAVVGCRLWLEQRLDPPQAMMDAIAEYREDSDVLGQWVAERCDVGAELEVQNREAYIDYQLWADVAGLKPWSEVVFARKMKEKFVSRRKSAARLYTGVGLKGRQSAVSAAATPKAKVPGRH